MIRLIQPEDAELLWILVDSNRAYLREWLPWLDFNTSIGDTRNFIGQSIADCEKKKSMVHVIVDDDLCGVCGFNSFNFEIKAGYIGYWIAERYQGRGLVAEGIRHLERIGFHDLGLNKIEIHVAVENGKSRAVAERLGYQETGVLRDAELLYGRYVDHVVYCKKTPAKEALSRRP